MMQIIEKLGFRKLSTKDNMEAIRAIDFNGVTILCRKDNKIEKKLIDSPNSYDSLNFLIVKMLIKHGSICFDVGANIGVYTMVMACLAGHDGAVHSFEPVKYIRQRLLANRAINSARNVVVNDFALGDVEGERLMFQVKEDQFRGGTSTFLRNNNVNEMGEEAFDAVPTRLATLDHYVTSQQIKRIDFLKIDVEGFEINVLRGARGVLAAYRPAILFEHDQKRLDRLVTSEDSLRGLFHDMNYHVFEPHLVNGVLHLLPFSFDRTIATNNLLAICDDY